MKGKTRGQEQAAPEKKKPVKRKPLPCGNCGRVLTVAAAGRCGTCYPVGRQYPEGSAEQAEALREVKERLQKEGPKRGVKIAKAAMTGIKVQQEPKKEIPDRREGSGETEKKTAAGVGTLTLIDINNTEDKIEGDPKIFLGYQRVRGDDGNRRKPWWIIFRALYVLCSTERIIIDAVRRGKLVLVEK